MTGFFDDNGDPQMDPYAVLKIQQSASETDIKKAYRTQMLQLHPDKLPPNLTSEEIAEVTAKFHTVKDAYEFLTQAQYLTARRLYMAKMASRRAEYERREAFLRRHNNNMNATSNSDPMPRNSSNTYPKQYSHRQYSHRSNNTQRQPSSSRSYAVPPRRKAEADSHKQTSEPNLNSDYGTRYGQGQSSGRRRVNRMGGAGQARMYKSGVNVNEARERGRHGGGGRAATTNTSSARTKRSKSSSSNVNSKESSRQQRTQSQPHASPRSRSRHRDQKREDSARFGREDGSDKENRKKTSSKGGHGKMSAEEERRKRSKSAPARYYSKNKSERNTSRAANKELPKEFFCPLTKRVMKDPVIDNDGHSYEREAIERWLRAQSSSPVTNEYLSLDMLQPNKELKSRIYKATGKFTDVMCTFII